MIHRLYNLRNHGKSINSSMMSFSRHTNDHSELSKIIGFRRTQWISFEEWDNAVR